MFKVSIVGLIIFAVFSAHAETKFEWKTVECQDGFSFQLREGKKTVDGYEYHTYVQAKLNDGAVLPQTDEGADSDLTFGNGKQALYISFSITTGSKGRAHYKGVNHQHCEMTKNIKDLRCKFLGECE